MAEKPLFTIANLIDDICDGPTSFGRICGFTKNPAQRAHDMKRRDLIPVDYWPRIVAWARSHRVSGITYKALVEAHVGERVD